MSHEWCTCGSRIKLGATKQNLYIRPVTLKENEHKMDGNYAVVTFVTSKFISVFILSLFLHLQPYITFSSAFHLSLSNSTVAGGSIPTKIIYANGVSKLAAYFFVKRFWNFRLGHCEITLSQSLHLYRWLINWRLYWSNL